MSSDSTDDIKERLRQIAMIQRQEFVSKTDKQYFGKKFTGERTTDDNSHDSLKQTSLTLSSNSKKFAPREEVQRRKTKDVDSDEDEDVPSKLSQKVRDRRNSLDGSATISKAKAGSELVIAKNDTDDSKDDKKVSKKSTKVSFADDTKVEDVDEEDTTIEIKSGYSMAVPTSKILKKSSQWRSFALKKRLAWFEKIMLKMRDPIDGLTFKSAGGWNVFDATPDAVNGVELAEWVRKTMKVLEPAEANLIIQGLIDYGYILPLEIAQETFIEAPTSLYSYQIEFFYFTTAWKISDEDYLNYLYRKQGAKLINEEENQILSGLVKKMNNPAKMITIAAETQKTIGKMSKKEKKLFEIREHAFWKTQKPLSTSNLYVPREWKNISVKRFTREQYRKNIKSRHKLLANIEEEIQYLSNNLSIYRVSTSTSVKNLIGRVTAYQAIDPMLAPENVEKSNWMRSEDAEWKQYKLIVPTKDHAKVWTTNFFDLYNDPLGITYFQKFLEKDLSTENLKFCQAVDALDNLPTRADFLVVAKKIMEDFIKTNSPYEININVQTRKPIVEMIEGDKEKIPYDIFYDAYQHIYHLMQTASFPRFVASDIVKELLA